MVNERKMLNPKPKSFFSNQGKMIKKEREGKIIKKIFCEKDTILSISLVSIQSHVIDNNDAIGREIIIAPSNVFFFAISEARKIIRAETTILIKLNIIFPLTNLKGLQINGYK